MKIISFFNHKGGVSKTTSTFHMGWKLAEKGFRVLLVDADPQCNLTALSLGYTDDEDIEQHYQNFPNSDLYSGLKPVIDGQLRGLDPATPARTANENLYILCGNIALAEAETQLSVALTTRQAIPAIRNLPGSIGHLLRLTGEEMKADYVLVDLSPSVGALNECILMASDHFIVPTAPDFFCVQAIRSLSATLPRWHQEVAFFRDPALMYPIPDEPPVMLGFLSQKYRPRNGAPARSFQQWIDKINDTVDESLVPALAAHKMIVSRRRFGMAVGNTEPFNLANIADFNSLVAQSQKYSVPVFCLTDAQLEQTGRILETMQESRDEFNLVFDGLADSIVALTA
ncbi:ParA family protein [Lysobacter sp. Root96]|uniref:ParA family protein n=1 Tax=Lysobacter sp. Root96 TaxID=1736612 RepID=UPI0006FCBB80|nr:ParA family protein [Lysobacter sp. Root96]KRD71430.1 hypothetical protein ASE45_06365 [Lysobacter sp. Root96]